MSVAVHGTHSRSDDGQEHRDLENQGHGNQTDAALHYGQAHRMLDDIHKEAHTDDVMKRSDLAAIYQESAKWQAPKS